jgi:hypothetical protein
MRSTLLFFGLGWNYVRSLRAFLTVFNGESYALTFGQRLITIANNSAEVNENVRAAIALRDETETFFFVKPFNGTSGARHNVS